MDDQEVNTIRSQFQAGLWPQFLQIESADIDDNFRSRLSHVLSRDYKKARFATSDVDAKRQVGLLEREWG
jgi:hypothetical protein